MTIDNVTFSILLGAIIILVYILRNKELPDISKASLLFISGQSFTYGLFFVLYSLTSNKQFFFDDRWMIGFGGFALLWIGIESFVDNIKKE